VKLPKFVIVDVVELVSPPKLNVTLPKPIPDAIIAPVDVDKAPDPVVPLLTVYVKLPPVVAAGTVPTAVSVAVLKKDKLPAEVSFKTTFDSGNAVVTVVEVTAFAVEFVAFNVRLLANSTFTFVIAA